MLFGVEDEESRLRFEKFSIVVLHRLHAVLHALLLPVRQVQSRRELSRMIDQARPKREIALSAELVLLFAADTIIHAKRFGVEQNFVDIIIRQHPLGFD